MLSDDAALRDELAETLAGLARAGRKCAITPLPPVAQYPTQRQETTMSKPEVLHHAVRRPSGDLLVLGDQVVIGTPAELAEHGALDRDGYVVIPIYGPEVPAEVRRPSIHARDWAIIMRQRAGVEGSPSLDGRAELVAHLIARFEPDHTDAPYTRTVIEGFRAASRYVLDRIVDDESAIFPLTDLLLAKDAAVAAVVAAQDVTRRWVADREAEDADRPATEVAPA